MPKRERDEAVAELSSTIFGAMLEEILMDVVQESHKEIARSRAVCDVCHARCGAVHVPGPSNATVGGSRIPTPTGDVKMGESPSATGTNTPVNGKEGTVYFECLECKRQIASNRYAPHLATCMGIGNRRGAARNASVRSKLGNEIGKAASPRLLSETADMHESSPKPPPPRPKGKAKGKKSDDAALNANGKRTASPSVSPVKKKKQKTAASPATRIKPDPEPSSNLLPIASSTSRVSSSSKLRASSTVSSLHREQRSSSPESGTRLSSPARSISTQASTVIRSPAIGSATLKAKQTNGKGRGAPAPPRIPSPPRPPPPVPVIRMHESDLFVDVDGPGDETGSSTDTDSD